MKLWDPVIFVDPTGVARGAVLNSIWASTSQPGVKLDENNLVIEIPDDGPMPSVNLVYTSGDPAKRDNAGYSRQIERSSSCVHQDQQGAHGNYWRRLTDTPKPTERQP